MNVSVPQVALHLGYLIPFFDRYSWLNEVYWTLAIEFQYYLLIAVTFLPLIRSGPFVRYFIYALVIGLSILFPVKFIFYWLPVFLLGIILFLYKAQFILKTEYYIATGILVIFCLFRYSVPSVIYSVIPLFCVLFAQDMKIVGLHYLGKFSYSLYLIHPLIGASFINVLSHRYTSPGGKIAVILGGIFVTILCSWLTYMLVERPSKKLSSSILYNKSQY